MEAKNLKIRASMVGKIMTNPRKSGEYLSQTAKTYIQEIAIEQKYGIKKEFWSRYTQKGINVEDESIALVNDVLEVGFIYKNEEYFENDFVKGTPDVITDDLIIDVKSSYDATTFPFFETEVPNDGYFYQMQTYMWLCNKPKALLCYCLVNTPTQIVEDEVRKEHWRQYKIDEDAEVREYIEKKHNFDHIPKENRVKVFEIERDNLVIDKIKERVELARLYYKQIVDAL